MPSTTNVPSANVPVELIGNAFEGSKRVTRRFSIADIAAVLGEGGGGGGTSSEVLEALAALEANKATVSALDALTNTVSGKATQTALAALTDTVNGKATQSALDATNASLAATVSEITLARGGLASLDARLVAMETARAAADASLTERVHGLLPGARERPGDRRALFTSELSGAAEALAPITTGAVVTNDDGRVLRFAKIGSDPLVVAALTEEAAELGQVYASRFAVRRAVNSSDPLGDSIEFGLACLNAQKQIVSTRILETFSLATADGRKSSQFTYSRDQDADITLSATTRYVRPFIRIYGGDGTTDVEVIGKWETNGLPGPKGDTGDLTEAAAAARDEILVKSGEVESDRIAAVASAQAVAATYAAASLAMTYPTVAAGIAGVADGQDFIVRQEFGEGGDLYRRAGADATWQKSVALGDLALALIDARADSVPAPLITAYSWQYAIHNNRGARSLSGGSIKPPLLRNLYGLPHGALNAGSGPTTTPFSADGPTKAASATRIAFTSASQTFLFWPTTYRPPAGTYTVRFKVKSDSGADAAVRYGNASVGYQAATALAASWTTLTLEFTTNGTDYSSFGLTGDGSNTPTLLLADVQIYPTAAAHVPAFASEAPGGDVVPPLGFPRQRLIGRALDNTAAAKDGASIIRLPSYPAVTRFDELTVIVAASASSVAANGHLISTDGSSNAGTTASTFNIAMKAVADFGIVGSTGITPFYNFNPLNVGQIAYAARVGPGLNEFWVDGVPVVFDADAFTGFDARLFRLAGAANTTTPVQTSFAWSGGIGAVAVWNRVLTDDQIAAETERLRKGLRAGGVGYGDMPIFLSAMGDSQTTAATGGRGPSWAYLQARDGTFSPNIPVRSFAVGGYTLNSLVAQLPDIARLTDLVNRREGRRHVVAIYVGTNDQVEIAADPAAYWQRLKDQLLEPIRLGGAEIAIGTLTPDSSTGAPATWETARASLNALMRADTRYTVMDFAADPVMGATATTTGGVYYEADGRHFTSAGQVLLAPIATAAIKVAARR